MQLRWVVVWMVDKCGSVSACTFAVLVAGCLPAMDYVDDPGPIDEGGGSQSYPWTPILPEEAEAGPQTLAMAWDGDVQQLVWLDAGGAFRPYGSPLPPAPETAVHRDLVWRPEVGRGAVVRESEGLSTVWFIDHGELTEIANTDRGLDRIQLSPTGRLIALQYADGGTSVRSSRGARVLDLDRAAGDRSNWLALSDADLTAVWRRRIDPGDESSDREYWLHEFESGRTKSFQTWPYDPDQTVYALRMRVFRHSPAYPEDSGWFDPRPGQTVPHDGPYPLGTKLVLGPDRSAFDPERRLSYRIENRGLESSAWQTFPGGDVLRFESGRYLLARGGNRLAYFDPDGEVLYELDQAEYMTVAVIEIPTDPDELSLLLSAEAQQGDRWETITLLWRPEQDRVVSLGREDVNNGRVARFAPDGSLVSRFTNGTLTVVYPAADAEVPLDTNYRIAGFSHPSE